jgi:sugar lactone lactonase YvrE
MFLLLAALLISPTQGPIGGGTIVTISGANFTGASVTLDRNAVTPLSRTDSEIRLQMPAHDNGYGVIQVGGEFAEFLYLPPRLQDLPPGYITTVAGVGRYVRTFGPATQAALQPGALVYDGGDNLYIAEANEHRVTRVDAAGNISLFASGNFFLGGNVADNVPAIDGGVSFPSGIAVGPGGNVYIATHSALLRKVNPRTGIISTVAGDNNIGFSGDGGPARNAKIGQATHVAADASNVYFIDWDNARIRRIDANGTISTYAGNGSVGNSGDGGPATSASINFGTSDDGELALDAQGNLFVAEAAGNVIRKIDPATGTITRFASLTRPNAIAIDTNGNVYCGTGGRVVKFGPNGQQVASWGTGRFGFTEDGPLTSATQIGQIINVTIDRANNPVFSDGFFPRVRRINLANNRLETVAGIFPALLNENGPALAAPLTNDNGDLGFDADGNLLIGDFRLRRLDRDGNLQTIAGGTPDGFRNDNIPAQLMANVVYGLDVTADGGIDISSGATVGHIDFAGIFHHLGGINPDCSTDGDGGPFRLAHLCQPWDTARDAAGNLYIADTNNNRIRRVDAVTGIITTIAGKGGPPNGLERFGSGTFCGDGGPAIDACLNTPYGITLDRDGSIYFTETWQRVRRISPDGIISTFAGANGLTKIVFGPAGFLYGSAFKPGRYDRNGNYTAIAGNDEDGFSGDGGPALQARLSVHAQASGVAIDRDGNFFFQDSSNRRVRAVRYGAVLAPPGATITASRNGSVIRTTVLDANHQPAPSVRVDFTAPTSGASCTLSNSFAITDENGVAAVVCTPNCVAGTYSVTAQPLTSLATATAPMTNDAQPCRQRTIRH